MYDIEAADVDNANKRSTTLGTAHASMSGDLSGKMVDLNIFVRKEKPCIPSENSLAG